MDALVLKIDRLPYLKNVPEQCAFEMLKKYLIFNPKEMFDEYKINYIFFFGNNMDLKET